MTDEPTLADALLPCPFCGGEADIDRDHTVEENHACGCRNCGLRFDTFNADDAIAAWNTRAELDRSEARVATLEGALQTIADMKPHHAGQTPNEYHMQQTARAAQQAKGE